MSWQQYQWKRLESRITPAPQALVLGVEKVRLVMKKMRKEKRTRRIAVHLFLP
jgi:hypothetical protein